MSSPDGTQPHPQRLREFVGMIWIDNGPGRRLSVWAQDSSDARRRVIEEYGEGHVISIWNEEDASRLR